MEVRLTAEPREGRGKGPARRLRAAGRVPGVLYGRDVEAVPVSVDAQELWHALHTEAGTNVLIDLAVDGQEYLTMPREVQRDILKGTLLHVDFLQIRRDVAIELDVPIQLVGESVGVKQGGVVEHHLWELRVECLPTEVPEAIEADITDLAIGDSLQVEALSVPEGVRILTPPEETVVSVVPPPVLEVEVPEEVPEEAVEGEEGAAPAAAEEGEAPAPEEEKGEEG